jgi:DNA-binding NarL/FixJ family response regulator
MARRFGWVQHATVQASVKIKVGIVEDSAGIRENWVKLINAGAGFQCVGACASGEEALKRFPALEPDVVLMDIHLPGISGIECTARLKQHFPKIQILMVTIHGDNDRVFAALKAGASGYLLKRTTRAELLDAITDVVRGGAPMTGEIARKVIDSFHAPGSGRVDDAKLSPREEEILTALTQGYSNKEIADRLEMGCETVRTHLRHIYEKLHVRSRTEAAMKYMRSAQKSTMNARAGHTPIG